MPLFIPDNDIKWSEIDEKLNIILPLRNSSHKDLTIQVANSYIKVSHPPEFWECFLHSSIDSEKSIVQTVNNLVTLELVKSEKGLWGNLKHSESVTREFCRQQRDDAIKEIQEKAAAAQKKKCTENLENHHASVRKQMKLDEMERKRIVDLKDAQCKLVTEEVEQLRNSMVVKFDKTVKQNVVVPSPSCETGKLLKDMIASDQVQSLRKFGNIAVSFTPRVFPTAARESQAFDEMKWLENQAAARETIELDTIELSKKERNPVWLKEKGDSFYARGDLHSAVNAYNLAIRICPTMYSLYCNRAACHLQLHNLHKAIEDSSKALELMGPLTSSNRASCCKCHVRRAVAFCQLELYVEGLMDFEAALKIQPDNEELKADAEEIRTLIQST